ncbi:MAG: hypothetical protein Q4C70_09960 [Planctomycetia bacterium]|nr:hypothetical protein [Planctomycetia bacterium]
MTEKFSSSHLRTQNGFSGADDFVAQLRNVSFSGAQKPMQRVSEKVSPIKSSMSCQSVNQPTESCLRPNNSGLNNAEVSGAGTTSVMEGSHFSREFLKYRSQIQRELNRNIPNVTTVSRETPSANMAEIRTFSATPSVSSSVSQPSLPRVSTSTVSSVKEFQRITKPVTRPAPIQVAPVRESANPYVSNSTFQSVLSENSSTVAENIPTQEKAEANLMETETVTVKNIEMETEMGGNNPFTKLVNTRREKKSGMLREMKKKDFSLASRHSWVANLRCFGTFGIVFGIGMALFSIFSATGTHQLTAMGFSLAISGVAMFATAGSLLAFQTEKKNA